MAVVEATHVEIRQVTQFGGQLEASKSITMGPWIQGHPILSIDQTNIEWTLEIVSGAAPTDR